MNDLYTARQKAIKNRNKSIQREYHSFGLNMAQLGRKYHLSRQRIHQIVKLSTVAFDK